MVCISQPKCPVSQRVPQFKPQSKACSFVLSSTACGPPCPGSQLRVDDSSLLAQLCLCRVEALSWRDGI